MISIEDVSIMMSIVEDMAQSYDTFRKISEVDYLVAGRQVSLAWIRQHVGMTSFTNDEYDTCIQLLDKFLSQFPEEPLAGGDEEFFTFVGTVCLVIALKIHNINHTLSYDYFTMFDLNELIKYESFILATIRFDVNPRSSPSNFVYCVLESVTDHRLKASLTSTACGLVREFWTVSTSMLYAPSTIAIASVAAAFAIMGMNCDPWMETIPDIFYSCSNSTEGTCLFDVPGCYESLCNLPWARRKLSPVAKNARTSPTSITYSLDEYSPQRERRSLTLDLDAIEKDCCFNNEKQFFMKPIISSP